MKAARIIEFGGPGVMQVLEIPIPSPVGKQVLINVKAAGVNPVDTYIRSGNYDNLPTLPFTPGMDGAGIVKEIGSDETRCEPEDRVWFSLATTGTYAEYALCDESYVRSLPERLSFEQGAALGVPYLTAFRALFHKCDAKPGETLLIHGASGGTGIAAAQLALAYGLTVFGTAGSTEGELLLKSVGVHHVFNHRKQGYMEGIMDATKKKGVDIILEMLANVNLGRDVAALGMYGRLSIIDSRGQIDFDPGIIMKKEIKVIGVYLSRCTEEELEESFDAVLKAIESGKVSPIVGLTYPLAESRVAHQEIIETTAAKGKMILTID